MTHRKLTGLHISAAGWLRKIAVDPDDIAGAINCRAAIAADLRHNIAVWFDANSAQLQHEPNLAAVSLLIDCGGHHPDTAPIPCGDVLVLGVNPITGAPADLARHQYESMAYALLASLAA
jgi:hypothetical protein